MNGVRRLSQASLGRLLGEFSGFLPGWGALCQVMEGMKSKSVSQRLRPALLGAMCVMIPFPWVGCTFNYDAYSDPIRHDYDYNDVEGYDSQTSGSPWYGQDPYGECDEYGDW